MNYPTSNHPGIDIPDDVVDKIAANLIRHGYDFPSPLFDAYVFGYLLAGTRDQIVARVREMKESKP